MVNSDKWANYIMISIGVLAVFPGAILLFDSFMTMSFIEARGVLGQAVYQTQYEKAMQDFVVGGVALAGGFAFILAGGIGYLAEVLKELSESE